MSITEEARGRRLIRDAATLNFDQLDVGAALRCTIGVLVPMIIGLEAGSVADGISAAIGALCAGFASFQGAYRTRVTATLWVGAGMAVATMTGALGAKADWSAVIVVASWAVVAAFMAGFGQAYLIVGLQWGVAAIIVNGVPMTTGQAVVRGLLMFGGGAVQTLLTVLTWAIRTYPAERSAVASVYRDLGELAGQATQSGESDSLTPAPLLANELRTTLGDPQPFGRPGQLLAFQALADEADRIRVTLAALGRWRRQLAEPAEREALDGLFAAAGAAVRSVGTAVLADAAPVDADHLRARIEQAMERLNQQAESTGPTTPWVVGEIRQSAGALAGQLRSVIRIAEDSASGSKTVRTGSGAATDSVSRAALGASPGEDVGPARSFAASHRPVRDSIEALRANLSWHSTIFRHAIRLGLAIALAMTIYRASGLAHGYWIPLTVLLVLRPDYNQTAVRGLSRVAGTIAGAGLATLVIAAFRPDTTGLTAMFSMAVLAAFLLVRLNYALFSVSVTAYVVFLLAFVELPAVSTAGARTVSTLIGGAIAIGAYLAWPTWESRLIGPRLASWLDAQAAYIATLLAVFERPDSPERSRLGERRSASRLARANAEVSLTRMSEEPPRSRREAPLSLESARGVLASERRISLSLLTLHGRLPTARGSQGANGGVPSGDRGVPEMAEFGALVASRLRRAADDLRALDRRHASADRDEVATVAPPHIGPHALRDAHSDLVTALAQLPSAADPAIPLKVLESETDVLVDAANTIAEIARRASRQAVAPPGPAGPPAPPGPPGPPGPRRSRGPLSAMRSSRAIGRPSERS